MPQTPGTHAFVGWNTYSRLTVSYAWVDPPFMWARGSHTPPELLAPVSQRKIKIDGAAGTWMLKAADGPDAHAFLDWDISSFVHRLRPTGPAAVIGFGGGRDVLAAVRAGAKPVVGIELNQLIVDLHRSTLADYSGLEQLPGVELVADEARSYLLRDSRRYRAINMSLIDTWAATGAGAYTLSENGLYTVEAWETFLSRLTDDGIFTVSRFYHRSSPGETTRMLALAMATLWRRGASSPRNHILVLQSHVIATLLLSAQPFSVAGIDLAHLEAQRLGFEVLASPREISTDPTLAGVLATENRADLDRFAAGHTLDITPPTDDRPFFFNMLKPGMWLDDAASVNALDAPILANLEATQTLVAAIAVSVLLTLVAIVAPLLHRRGSLRGVPRGALGAACAYFALIGLGFMFVEIALLSRLNVLMGHPVLGLAVVLGGIILFAGIGSLLSSRVPLQHPRVAQLYPLVPVVSIALAWIASPPLIEAVAAAHTPVRILVGLSIVALPGLGMGLCFPLGLTLAQRLVRASGDPLSDFTPWLWGINGACGVSASGLALACTMVWGVPTTLAIGASCYLALCTCTRVLASVPGAQATD